LGDKKEKILQIGRIFANCPYVYLGIFLNYKSSPDFWVTFIHGKSYMYSHFGKKWVGLHFDLFITNPSLQSPT
jgi:hypothetical protein